MRVEDAAEDAADADAYTFIGALPWPHNELRGKK